MVNDWLIYGTEKQCMDIKYIFDINIIGYSDNINIITENIVTKNGIILCGRAKDDIYTNYVEIYGKDRMMKDDELIESLNYSFGSIMDKKDIYIWGTGYWCDRFMEEERFLKQNITIKGYIDNLQEKKVGLKNGIEIYGKEILNPKKNYVVVATDEIHFCEIQNDLRNIGYKDDEYIYFKNVIDDVAGMFRKVYECDTYYNVVCKNKDLAVRINNQGQVSTCCMAYDSILGNVWWNSFEDIWKSKKAEITRLALENHTYVFCDKERCPFLSGNIVGKSALGKGYRKQKREYPESIAPEVDNTCNLTCTSCRKRIIYQENDYLEQWTDKIIRDIAILPVRLIINTVGEPFASKYSKRIIYSRAVTHRHDISIYTNGTLLSKNVLNELLEMYDTVEFAISVDAYYKRTYNKIRKGGNFEKLMDNISEIMEQRRNGKVTYIQLNYVLQKDNISEMSKFIQWGTDIGVDCIAINAIENWGIFTEEEYRDVSIIQNGAIKEEYVMYFTHEILSNKLVNFHNISNYIETEPKRMYMV